MLDRNKAEAALTKEIENIQVKNVIRYKDVYLFLIERNLIGEEDYDPFYSVNIDTGEVREFSVLTDGDILEISELFQKEAFE